MASYALLIGTKDGKRSLVADGSPPEVRKQFKHSDGEGFDRLEVIETGVGKTRQRQFFKKPSAAPKAAKKATKKTN